MENSDKTESLLDMSKIEIERDDDEIDDKLAYDVDEIPPLFVALTTAFQYTFLCIGSVLAIITVSADIACADLNDPVRSTLFSSSVLIIGLSTAAQSYLGLRLPVFQGASASFLIPLFALKDTDAWKCPAHLTALDMNMTNMTNMTSENVSYVGLENHVFSRLAELQGSLIAASMFEVVIGLTGMIGILMKFISPIVIGVTIFCLGYSLYPIVILLCTPHWGISIIGSGIMIVMSLYLSHVKVPIPQFNRKSGKGDKKFPVFQVFPVLITIIIMWITCLVCTHLHVFSGEKTNPSYRARTDVRNHVIKDTPWILIPYPGQFGTPKFNSAIFIGFLISVITSIIESVGDYIATARVCHAYPVPRHALNRGIAVEGISSVLAGLYGTAHATTSYSTCLSLLNLTKIGSRSVLVLSGLIACILAIFGKFGAFMTSVPDPVLGGITLAMLGVLCSLGISAFQSIQLRSSRNISVIGFSVYFAVVMSEWQRKFPDSLKSDSEQVNQIVKVTLGNAMFIGFVFSFILDNTVKGTDKERGIFKNENNFENKTEDSSDIKVKSRYYLFDLPLVGRLQKRCKILRYAPFLQPYIRSYDVNEFSKDP